MFNYISKWFSWHFRAEQNPVLFGVKIFIWVSLIGMPLLVIISSIGILISKTIVGAIL